MAEVKWIKITTDIFDDEKILMIEALPAADSIIVIWFKLLAFAGKQNNDGVFLMSNRIAYTDEMLASIFRRDVNALRLALSTFETYGMIEIINNVITIPNWNKHQTLDAYEKKKQRDRLYQAERRAAQKALVEKSSDSQTTPSSYIAISEEDKEREEEKEELSKDNSKKPTKHKYGEYSNVLLSDADMEKLKAEFPDWQARIERLSSYMASTGKSYKNHLATIRNWARKDAEKLPKSSYKHGRKEIVPAWMDKEEDDLDRLERQMGLSPNVQARADALKERLGC